MKVEELNQKQEWIAKFLSFCYEPKGFMFMSGKNGTGKTTSAKAIYDNVRVRNEHEYEHNPKYFYTQSDLHQRFMKEMQEWKNATYLIHQLASASLLVLDDIGTRAPTSALNDFFYAIIEKRERAKEKVGTIITTNLNAKDMREIFGDAIVSRVASGQVFRFEGKDRRFKEF